MEGGLSLLVPSRRPREEIVLTNDAFIECYVARRRHFLPATFFEKKDVYNSVRGFFITL